jgi:hypothetical protein
LSFLPDERLVAVRRFVRETPPARVNANSNHTGVFVNLITGEGDHAAVEMSGCDILDARARMRTLLIRGARAVLRHLEHRPNQTHSWLVRLIAPRNRNVAAVALANKNVRVAWALLAHQREFEPDYASAAPNRQVNMYTSDALALRWIRVDDVDRDPTFGTHDSLSG